MAYTQVCNECSRRFTSRYAAQTCSSTCRVKRWRRVNVSEHTKAFLVECPENVFRETLRAACVARYGSGRFRLRF
jgi:hypothetical protein